MPTLTAATAPPAPGTGTAPQRPGVLLLRWSGLLLTLTLVTGGSVEVVTTFFRQTDRVTTPLADGVHRVILSTEAGGVRLRAAAPAEEATLTRRESWAFARASVTSSTTDGVLTAEATCPDTDPLTEYCSVDFELVLPVGTDVELRTVTGDIDVRGMSGTIRTSTGTGGIRLDEVSSASVRATTSTGDVRVKMATPPVNITARSSTGDVTVKVPDDGTVYRVVTGTSVGNRTVQVPTDSTSSRVIEAVTSMGDVKVRHV